MLAALFYPKELKEVIEDLRENNDLNMKALNNIHSQLVPILFFGLIWAIILVSLGLWGLVALIPFSVLLGLLFMFVLRNAYENNYAPYLFGQKRQGIVAKSYDVNLWHPMRIIVLNDKETSKEVRIAPGAIWSKKSGNSAPALGDDITYFCYDRKKHRHMPDDPMVMQYFCLSKSLIEDCS
tara:strand:+ start:401 stop:943 length:543 start_codon:yes stop_codon:yes gene_type:complete